MNAIEFLKQKKRMCEYEGGAGRETAQRYGSK